MKVLLLVNETDTTGGTGRNSRTMATSVRAAGYDVEILGYKGGDFFRFAREARRHAKHADVVQAIDMNPLGFVGFLATRFTRAKFVIVAQAAYAVAPLYSRKSAIPSWIAYRSADAVVAGSAFVAREIQKKVPSLTVDVIDPGIDIAKFPSTTRSHERGTDAPFILGVGAVKARKGYDVSLRAFALARKDIPNLRYVVVGSQTNEPKCFKMLTELARELGVERDVEFLENVPDEKLNKLYERAALFILTSVNIGFHFEGFGMVFLEAAAHGLPCIGTFGNGIEGAVEDGKTGILVPQKDAAATAEAIKRIITDEPLARRMGERARAFASEHDVRHLTSAYDALYRRITA